MDLAEINYQKTKSNTKVNRGPGADLLQSPTVYERNSGDEDSDALPTHITSFPSHGTPIMCARAE